MQSSIFFLFGYWFCSLCNRCWDLIFFLQMVYRGYGLSGTVKVCLFYLLCFNHSWCFTLCQYGLCTSMFLYFHVLSSIFRNSIQHADLKLLKGGVISSYYMELLGDVLIKDLMQQSSCECWLLFLWRECGNSGSPLLQDVLLFFSFFVEKRFITLCIEIGTSG